MDGESDDGKGAIETVLPIMMTEDRLVGVAQVSSGEGHIEDRLVKFSRARDGQPITSDMYSLEAISGSSTVRAHRIYRFEHKGPARCSTPTYRFNYETIFGKGPDRSLN